MRRMSNSRKLTAKTCDEILPVRVPSALLEALEREAVRQRAERPGQRITRADVVRTFLYEKLGDVGASVDEAV